MADLEGPIELLDEADGETVEFRILRWEEGEALIHPRLEPGGKVVPVIRMWVPGEDKPLGAPYWDLTARTTQARLRPVLDELVRTGRRIRVIKHGVAPTARHQVDFL